MKNKSFSMNKELCSLIGLLLSDGSIYYDKSKCTYCIQFTNKLESMRNYFKSLVTKLFETVNFSENRCKNAISIRFFSKEIAEFLFHFSPTYRTLKYSDGSYPNCKIPSEIKESEEFSAEFLKAFASCDGSVNFNPKHSTRLIEIACYHPSLLDDLVDCFKTLGIKCRVCKNSIRISNRKEIKKFANSVGFLDESFVSDRNSKSFGISKTEKLSELIR